MTRSIIVRVNNCWGRVPGARIVVSPMLTQTLYVEG